MVVVAAAGVGSGIRGCCPVAAVAAATTVAGGAVGSLLTHAAEGTCSYHNFTILFI